MARLKSTCCLSTWCSGMSKPVTCTLCGGQVDDADAVPMPNGPMCLDPCYFWLEALMEQTDDEDDDEFEVTIIWEDEE